MGNEFKGVTAHSAEYFGDTRDFWWHHDFLHLLAARWQLDVVRSALDVGCGVGHWGRLPARVLPDDARVAGIDRESRWLDPARERAAAAGLGVRFTYQVGTAEALPFADGAFDLVTCQTLLIHTRDPERVLAEMLRVTRPGGLIVVAESNNLVGLVVDSIVLGDSPDLAATLLRFQLHCQRGKAALGEGNDLLGEALPTLLAGAGLRDVELRINDRARPMLPPYRSKFERAFADEILDTAAREIWIWPRDATHRYFLAGGGDDGEFAELWRGAMDQRRRVADAIRENRYACAGGSLFYVAWGWKDGPSDD